MEIVFLLAINTSFRGVDDLTSGVASLTICCVHDVCVAAVGATALGTCDNIIIHYCYCHSRHSLNWVCSDTTGTRLYKANIYCVCGTVGGFSTGYCEMVATCHLAIPRTEYHVATTRKTEVAVQRPRGTVKVPGARPTRTGRLEKTILICAN